MTVTDIPKHGMVMRAPATRWQDASPTGNGTVGAMMYGQICNDTILLNHEALYYPRARKTLVDVSDLLPQVRELIAQGKYREASEVVPRVHAERGGSPPGSTSDFTDPFQPFCDIQLKTSTQGPFREYRRGVDFSTGRIWIEWADDNGSFTREAFVSRASDTAFLRIRGNQPGSISHRLKLCPHDAAGQPEGIFAAKGLKPADYHAEVDEEGNLTLVGQYADSFAFGAIGRVTVVNGTASVDKDELIIDGADEVLLQVKLFIHEEPEDSVPRLRNDLQQQKADFDQALAEHVVLHGELFNRMSLELTSDACSSNEEMLMDAYDGVSSTELAQTLYRYGRYLLICSSCPGGWPANLQGIWNGDYSPAWNSDFHTDENIQMNYWQALPGNTPELALCVFDYFERYLDDYRTNARLLYGCRGICIPIAQTTDGIAHPGIWTNWVSAAGWLAQLFYDYFLFTADREFLAERAVPWLREVALFYEDFLFEGADDRLMFSPSLSPENSPTGPGMGLLTVNATMDVAICREVLSSLCDACEVLGVEADGVVRWRSMLNKLPEYAANEDGALREWLHPTFRDNYHHRHQSHLYPLFPGLEITEESRPELYEACRVAVEKRLVIGLTSQSGWSLAHMANVYARLGKGDRALECIDILAQSSTGPNLFTYHNDWRNMGLSLWSRQPPFQIDANFGLSAAILEMLVFSKPGIVKLLPALPERWSSGRVKGIACRGGIQVDVEWDMDADHIAAAFVSKSDQIIQVKLPDKPDSITVSPDGTEVQASALGDAYLRLSLRAGEVVNVQASLG